jgi:ABC-type multidrug transport system fused ATPase/permease subunit
VVLDRGRIAELGTHAELLARNGIYANLYNIQYSMGEAAARVSEPAA